MNLSKQIPQPLPDVSDSVEFDFENINESSKKSQQKELGKFENREHETIFDSPIIVKPQKNNFEIPLLMKKMKFQNHLPKINLGEFSMDNLSDISSEEDQVMKKNLSSSSSIDIQIVDPQKNNIEQQRVQTSEENDFFKQYLIPQHELTIQKDDNSFETAAKNEFEISKKNNIPYKDDQIVQTIKNDESFEIIKKK